LELSEKKIKNQQGKNAKNTIMLSIICHRYFDTYHFITCMVRLFPGLFWGQPFDSSVNKINNLATQSWKKYSGLHRKLIKIIWPELSSIHY
jgi:hypothetical protein